MYEDRRERIEYWDFRKVNTKEFTHGLHPYPAMMIPQVARELIKIYGKNSSSIIDPFMGSGSTLVEAFLTDNIKYLYGLEINPLAILIAKVKTQEINLSLVEEYKKKLQEDYFKITPDKIDFKNIDFWFKDYIINDLSKIRKFIFSIENNSVKDFFLVTLSETVRKVSNQKKGEFKLVKMKPEQLEKHQPDVLNIFNEFLNKNILAIKELRKHIGEYYKGKEINIFMHDSTKNKSSIDNNSIDLLVTSPPYGDSKTTVAYGQFSRLNSQWIGFENDDIMNVDKECLGGKPSKNLEYSLKSPTLQKSIDYIASIDEKRAKEILSFYIDFDKSIDEIDRVMKIGSHLCFVVGNRTVKKHKIKTDEIISELFVNRGNYEHEKTIIREIPNKRMPKKNSPTNKKGELVETMNNEYIVILKKLR